jgi:hypothetical protein
VGRKEFEICLRSLWAHLVDQAWCLRVRRPGDQAPPPPLSRPPVALLPKRRWAELAQESAKHAIHCPSPAMRGAALGTPLGRGSCRTGRHPNTAYAVACRPADPSWQPARQPQRPAGPLWRQDRAPPCSRQLCRHQRSPRMAAEALRLIWTWSSSRERMTIALRRQAIRDTG